MKPLLLSFGLGVMSLFASAQPADISLNWLRSTSLYYNGGPTHVNSIAAGSDGSVVAVGYMQNTVDFEPGPDTIAVTATSRYDIFIAKYSKTGHIVYALHFGDKTGTAYEAASSVVLDEDGNVYVTGNFKGTIDFDPGAGTTLLSAAATEVFIASYDKGGAFRNAIKATSTASDNKVQTAKAIVVDKQRNVYITGSFVGSVDFDPGDNTARLGTAGKSDIFFAKYDAKGRYKFAKRAGGENNDITNDIALDNENNIIICGQFSSASADFDPGAGTQLLYTHGRSDIFFAKYDTAGNYLFAKQIGAASNDVANALTTLSDNSIVVTGFFRGKNVDFDAGDSSYLINSNSDDAFVTRYKSNGNFDYAFTIGGIGGDYSTDIVADSSSNYFITGTFYGDKVDFDPGTPVYNLPVTEGQRIFIAKYTGAGAFEFANSFGTASKDDNRYAYTDISSLAVDKSGNVLAGGNFSDTLDVDAGTRQHLIYEPYYALFIASYTGNSGAYKNSLHTDVYFNYYNAASTVQASATDDSGNVYTAGTINGRFDFDYGSGTYLLESKNDYRTSIYFAKYNKNGNLVYAKEIIGGWYITGMVLDKDNDIYLTGMANGTTDFDPGAGVVHWNNNTLLNVYGHFFAKYSNGGNLRYAKGISNMAEGSSLGIAVDRQKNVYLAGYFYEAGDYDPGPGERILTPLGTNDLFYSKYDSSGNYVFAYNIGCAGDYAYQKATDIKLSSKGNLVICGYINGNNIDFDPGGGQFFLSGSSSGFITSYKNDGSFMNAFAVSVVNGGYGSVNMNTIALDNDDNVYVAGDYFGKVDFDPGPHKNYIHENNGIFVASYSKTGQYRFAKGTYTYPENTSITRLALDKDRNIYITGHFNTPVLDLDFGPDSAFVYNEAYHYPDYSNTDIFLAKYDSLCNYTYGYDIGGDSANGYNDAYALNVEKNGNIIIGGSAKTKLDFDISGGEVFLQPTAIYGNLFLAQYAPVSIKNNQPPVLFTIAGKKPALRTAFYPYHSIWLPIMR